MPSCPVCLQVYAQQNFSTSVEYPLNKILVIDNRDELGNYEGFWKVDKNLNTPQFKEMFNYYPASAKTLDIFFNVPPLKE